MVEDSSNGLPKESELCAVCPVDSKEGSSVGAASPNSEDADSESVGLPNPDAATVALRSACMDWSVAATRSSLELSTAPVSAPVSASAPSAPSAPSPVPPPPPIPIGIPRPMPPDGIRLAISLIILSADMPCNQTVPGPVNVVTKSPSPPNMTFLKPDIVCTSNSTSCVKATRLPDETRNASPSSNSFLTKVPPAFIKTSPSPIKAWSTNPSPPKNPELNFFVNSISISTPILLAR
mmetsp:Transcript_21700/g.32131  ORF Transcript_21700/g.32131 Transcript_21700/m.32131 type:complete len:236 (-) Transcript_21700:530-1237(-)